MINIMQEQIKGYKYSWFTQKDQAGLELHTTDPCYGRVEDNIYRKMNEIGFEIDLFHAIDIIDRGVVTFRASWWHSQDQNVHIYDIKPKCLIGKMMDLVEYEKEINKIK